MEIDWQNGPGLKTVKELKLIEPEVYYLDNGIKVLVVSGESKPITKIDIVFKGARWLERKKIAARFVSALLRDGTTKQSGLEIAETFDFHGANIKSSSNLDYNYISFSCLNKHLNSILPLVAELVLDPLFDNNDIDKYRQKSIDNLSLDLARNELNCYREFTAALYGKDHPYGYNTNFDTLENINREDIIDQYNRSFNSDNCFIVVTGNPTASLQTDLNKAFGQFQKTTQAVNWDEPKELNQGKTFTFDTKNDLQSAIKIGRRVVTQQHEDYAGLYMVNTILGGYFGSRLMSSIREEQGLTYNIYSTIDNLKYDGYLYIATEVANDSVSQVIDAIHVEIELLKSELVPSDELVMVKNYLTGNFLSLIDGPFHMSSLLRSLEIEGRSIKDFELFYSNLLNTTSQDLITYAEKYLKAQDQTMVIIKKE